LSTDQKSTPAKLGETIGLGDNWTKADQRTAFGLLRACHPSGNREWLLLADSVEKVESNAMAKISLKSTQSEIRQESLRSRPGKITDGS
jgi:hypothetical protein